MDNIKKIDIPRMTQEEFIQLCQETLNTARTIEALLRGLNTGYGEALDALKNLRIELEKYINDFHTDTAELEKKLNSAKQEIAEVLTQIEDIKPKIEKINQVAEQTETSLQRLEEINTNIIQIEQRIKELIASINIEELENFAKKLKNDLEETKNEKISEIKAAYDEAVNTIHDAFDEIQKQRDEAIKAIQDVAGTGWKLVLQECISTKNHALTTLSLKKIDRDKFDRIGMVINLSARIRKIPAGLVKPNTNLSVIDYALLYYLSGSKSLDGKTFKINLPDAKPQQYIYSGKEN